MTLFTEEQRKTMERFQPRVSKVCTTVRLSFGDNSIKSTDYVFLYLDVERNNVVSINTLVTEPLTEGDRTHIFEWLIEHGWAEWSECLDIEVATEKLMEIVRNNDKYSSE